MLSLLTRNISWNYLQAGVGLVVYFVLTPIVIGHLGAVGYGVWVLLNAILFYLRFLDFGFYNALVKYAAQYSAERDWVTVNGLIGTTGGVLALAGVAGLMGSALVAWLLVPNAFNVPAERITELQQATLLVGVNLLIAFPGALPGAVLESRQRFDLLGLVSVPLKILAAIGTVVLLEAGYGVTGLVWVMIATNAARALGTAACVWRFIPEIRLGIGSVSRDASKSHFERIRGYSAWTSLNEILAEGSAELQKLLVPIFLSVSLLTPYTLMITVSAVIFLAIEPVTNAFFPLSATYDPNRDKRGLQELLMRGTKLVTGVSLALAVPLAVHGREFILVWIGADNVQLPTAVLPIVVVNFTLTAFVLTATTVLLGMGRAREVFWMGVAELCIAVVLVVVTVQRTELAGLAGSLLVANAIVTFGWIVPYVCRLLDARVTEFLVAGLGRPLVAAVPALLALVWVNRTMPADSLWRIALGSFVAGIVYAAAFLLVSLTSDERAIVRREAREMLAKRAGLAARSR